MGLLSRAEKKMEHFDESIEVPVVTKENADQELEFLIQLVRQIRPSHATNYKEAELKFRALLDLLHRDPNALSQLRRALRLQFLKRSFVPALTQSGLPESRGFLQEIVKKAKHKILPPLLDPEDLLYAVHHIFYKHKDHTWVRGINRKLWMELFELIGVQTHINNDHVQQGLNEALHILTQQTVTLGLEKEIMGGYLKIKYQEYSFYLLDQAVQNYLHLYEHWEQDKTPEAVAQIVVAIENCRATIHNISEQRKEKGTSLAQTFLITRIERLLDRLLLVTDILNCDHCFNAERFLNYFTKVISYEKTKNSIRSFLHANIGFLTYKITEHGGSRGRKYMTVTRQEYWWMLRSSMGGGFIVCFTALVKNLITKVPLPPFWLGFSYSVNYAVGFQLMHETHTTLATKQPAYTAAAIASSIDYFKSYEKSGLYIIAIIIARTARTQLASFFGNLVVVFPVAYGLAALYHSLMGQPLLDHQAAIHTLEGQHPFFSFSILYACITGVFLFLSGLIAGYVENEINYGNIGERLRNNPVFKNMFSVNRLEKLTAYIENNMGALVGNIALGFFLGMAGFFGKIFGIPFDIRHITIASGNAAMAYYTTGNAPGNDFLLTVFAGLLLIGLFNFLVSFALAFTVAVRSRGVRLRDYPELAAIVTRFFIRYPMDFIFPPKSEVKKSLS